jgi:hypothetical protein
MIKRFYQLALDIRFNSSPQAGRGAEQVMLQSGVRQYLHRMVVCLEDEILPYIPIASETLLTNCDCKSIQEYIPLINQVISKFKVSVVSGIDWFQSWIFPFSFLLYLSYVRRMHGEIKLWKLYFNLNAVILAIPERGDTVSPTNVCTDGGEYFH